MSDTATTALTAYLHQHIPLSAAMQAWVISVSTDQVTLAAPLVPNINHQSTVFGGSASALAILSAWSLLHLRLTAERIPARLVIQSNSVEYDLPLTGEFSACAALADKSDWPKFVQLLRRRGRARIAAQATLFGDRREAGRFSGRFVAMVG